jgi:Clathrin adaptor complex small chain
MTTDMTGEAMDKDGNNSAAVAACGWGFIVLMSRQGKIRLSEFFASYSESEKRRILRDIAAEILPRAPKMCNIIEKGAYKYIYRRYASLYFVVGIPPGVNELIVLEQIHLFVEALDGYFNSGTCFFPPTPVLNCTRLSSYLYIY